MKNVTDHTRVMLGLLLSAPSLASANAGVPMIMFAMPALIVSLLPIIGVETLILRNRLALPSKAAFKLACLGNLASTLLGVPITWLILVAMQMLAGGGGAFDMDTTLGRILAVTVQAPWLLPYESHMHWMIPTAGIVLLVPFFFVSWRSEYLVAKHVVPHNPKEALRKTIRDANLATYVLLALWPFGFLAM